MTIEKYDTIIIGAGMSGLAAGMRLAHYDQKVCILDRHSLWGGLNSFYKKEGRSFDVGLHAMTNFAKKGDKKGPLPTIMRQLRLNIDDLGLFPQKESRVQFPQALLRFSNELDLLSSEISANFPAEIDGFIALCTAVREHNDGTLQQDFISARSVIRQHIKTPLLEDMILCPLMFYGSATEHDMDWNQFVIMFKSIFFEGFSRPHEGVRKILTLLRSNYLERGGELKMRSGVKRLTPQKDGGVIVELENGNTLLAKTVLSSAGYVETLNLLGKSPTEDSPAIGALSFVESIFCLDDYPKNLDINSTINFFSHSEKLNYRQSNDLVDYSSGILCCPNNFQDPVEHKEGMIRLTHIANHKKWVDLKAQSVDLYNEEKSKMTERAIQGLQRIIPEFRKHITYIDTFTPSTIERYTSHLGGAVYGTPFKKTSGDIGEKNIFLCGTDQGYLGIVGSMLSGIIMANRHALK